MVKFEDVDFEFQTDVVVVGAGACGLTAALAARDAGAEVFVLERDATPAGSTAMSQGLICAAGTKLQADAGIEDNADLFFDDIMARTRGTADPLVARVVANEAGPTIDWMIAAHGIPFELRASWSGFFGHSASRMHGTPSKTGTELVGALVRATENAGANIVCDALVDEIYARPDGTIRGVSFLRPDGGREFVGCRALVAATCGFGANTEMVRKYIPDFSAIAHYRYFGHEGNDGSGIRWGLELGAGTGSMNAFQGYGSLAMPQSIVVNYDMVMNGGFVVNLDGERFSDELADISGQAINVLSQRDGVGWMIFDERRHEQAKHLPEYRELDAIGAFKYADDLDCLASVTGLPADRLKQTVASVENAIATGQKCPFGRDFAGVTPLRPPYRAVRVTGALFHTQGGLLVDESARVLRPDGTPLPNFFAGGGAARGISGDGPSGYLPAAGLCTAVTLGRLAGRNAAVTGGSTDTR
ncbi:FAD-dependent oxidoreductase [Oricola thermophila]|uniref:FAD-dependent oxidoreductase n=1 Tax=Oricola thermophila TaxID=2742145 RepID=A0A6N1VDM2_9HYPH|nr:FAD-dependent oxidoreductase [Oricola thermophila]QKV19111.1 FAD-dependent oxidoreductase [Oricola thermophila]